MTQRQKTITVTVCDGCGKDCDYATKCLGCGKAFCYECRKIAGVEYTHAVYFSGSGDGFYCNPCDARLSTNGNALHSAYRAIKRLRDEAKAWGADFDGRIKESEDRLKRLAK